MITKNKLMQSYKECVRKKKYEVAQILLRILNKQKVVLDDNCVDGEVENIFLSANTDLSINYTVDDDTGMMTINY